MKAQRPDFSRKLLTVGAVVGGVTASACAFGTDTNDVSIKTANAKPAVTARIENRFIKVEKVIIGYGVARGAGAGVVEAGAGVGAGVVRVEDPGKRVSVPFTPKAVPTNRTATPAVITITMPMAAPVIIPCAFLIAPASYAKNTSQAPAYKKVIRKMTPENAIKKFANRTPVLIMSVSVQFPVSVHVGKLKRSEPVPPEGAAAGDAPVPDGGVAAGGAAASEAAGAGAGASVAGVAGPAGAGTRAAASGDVVTHEN